MQTTSHTNQQVSNTQITVPYYTTGYKSYKVNSVAFMEICICQNGKRIYTNKFRKEQRAINEVYAQNFIKAMKAHDSKVILAEIEDNELEVIQNRYWDLLLSLQQSGTLTQREASTLALPRFTWTKEQTLQNLKELSNRVSTSNF